MLTTTMTLLYLYMIIVEYIDWWDYKWFDFKTDLKLLWILFIADTTTILITYFIIK